MNLNDKIFFSFFFSAVQRIVIYIDVISEDTEYIAIKVLRRVNA